MVSITLSVPEEIKKEMDQFHDINWSAVARAAIQQRLALLRKFREFARESVATEGEVLELGRKVNAAVWKRHQA